MGMMAHDTPCACKISEGWKAEVCKRAGSGFARSVEVEKSHASIASKLHVGRVGIVVAHAEEGLDWSPVIS
jgi:hypothetical protein